MAGLQLLARSVQRLAANAIGAKQPDLAGLMAAWPQVVGIEWAARTTPLVFKRLRGNQPATLELAVSEGEALLVQHESPVLLGRINAYFGHNVVGQLRIKPLESKPYIPSRKKPANSEPMQIEGIDDPELSAALGRLGAAIRESGRVR